ncbi:hypothetical protein CPT_Madawaska_066 [Staphylococcus phage Madawaska]|nr:hypothetical protein CPT_Madawaska_066 [Staphylococcus phage Madawaska]
MGHHMTINNRDLLSESIKKLLNGNNILNEAEDDETNNDSSDTNTDDTSSEDTNSDNEESSEENTETEEENQDDSNEDDSITDDSESDSELDDGSEENSDEDNPLDDQPEEENNETKETNSDKYLKLQIFNKLNDLIDVSLKFKDIVNEKNMESFDKNEKEKMSEVTVQTSNNIDSLIDSINLFNNKFINNIDADKCEKLYKKFENTYNEIFNIYLKEYNKLNKDKKSK